MAAQDPDRSISASAGMLAHNSAARPIEILLSVILDLLAYHLAEHAVGFHLASLASFLYWEVITKGWLRYIGSVVMIVTTINGSPLGSLIKSKYSTRLVFSLYGTPFLRRKPARRWDVATFNEP